jgi:hypothetical protein
MSSTPEHRRLSASPTMDAPWRAWGPFLSERQWGTVREDYSANGDAWSALPHDHARSRAYRWGEDGIAGISDRRQRLCLALALWNGRDPILKERFFGLTNAEGNHGEDVKEEYAYLDATPTHSYLRMAYAYPQAEYPYAQLIAENARRSREEREYELRDTGVLADNRVFDVVVEYAKLEPDDILMRVSVTNRGPETASCHVVPQLWFRNTWSWDGSARPRITARGEGVFAQHAELGEWVVHADGAHDTLFTHNDTNVARCFHAEGPPGPKKDAFHDAIVRGDRAALASDACGTKVGFWSTHVIEPGATATVRLRLARPTREGRPRSFARFDEWIAQRRAECDAFYDALLREQTDPQARAIQRQAFAGLLWSQQYYELDVPRWLSGDLAFAPPPAERQRGRNADWDHLNHADVLSMPDKWEYPWYAAWDLAFHTIPLALVDAAFAKEQLVLLTREWFMHPNGQLPAYEWNFSDVNPPVHAWAAWRVFQIDRKRNGHGGDFAFLERVFHKLMLNFTWWVNRKDASGKNVFQGGFLGLDNIGVFDRSRPLPTGGTINQSDGTSWMAMYALNLMRIALELATRNPVYEDIATKFFEHFLHIAKAMTQVGGAEQGLWDERDGFYYDVLCLPDGRSHALNVRSMVGLIPLCAVETLEPELLDRVPAFKARLEWFLEYRPDLAALVSQWDVPGRGKRRLLSLSCPARLRRLLRRMLDPAEFLSEFGLRSLSKVHATETFRLDVDGTAFEVRYEPAESSSGLFGGNSNWRGPIWMPLNFLIVESLQKFHHYYGDLFVAECPVGSGDFLALDRVAEVIGERLSRTFLRDADGRRPVFGDDPQRNADPLWSERIPFHEYFHGETGEGIGAAHQTGWTALIAKLLMPRAREVASTTPSRGAQPSPA